MPDMPQAYTQFDQKYDRLERILETIRIDHIAAYTKGVEAALIGQDGLVDYDRLNDPASRKNFTDTLNAAYVSGARRMLQVDPNRTWNDFQRTMGESGVYGFTTEQLVELVNQQGENFTLNAFTGMVSGNNGILARQRALLEPITYNHITTADKPSMLHAIGVGEERLSAADVTLEKLIELMKIYRQNGGVPDNALIQRG